MSIYDVFSKRSDKKIKEVVKQEVDNLFLSQSNINNIMNLYNQLAPIEAVIGSYNLHRKIPNKWIMLNLWANYFANLFEMEGCKQTKILVRWAIRNAAIYGSVYLVKDRYDWKVAFKGTKENHYKILPNNHDMEVEIDKDKLQEVYVSEENTIYYQYDSWGMGLIVILDYWLEFEKRYFKTFNTEVAVISDKLKFVFDGDKSIDKQNELVRKFEDNDSVSFVVNNENATIVKPITNENNVDSIINMFEYIKNYWYELLGRRTNLNQDSRSNAKEEDERNDSFTILERDKKEHLEAFLELVSKKLHKEIKIKEVKSNDNIETNRQKPNKNNQL